MTRLLVGSLLVLVAIVRCGVQANDAGVYRGGTFLYVPDMDHRAVAQFFVGGDGQLSALSPPTIDTDLGPAGAVATPDGRFVYVHNAIGPSISQFAVANNGTLVKLSPAVVRTRSANAIRMSPNGRFVYLVHDSAVDRLAVGPDGTLSGLTTVASGVGSFDVDIAFTPDGKHAYVASSGDKTVVRFAVAADGSLRASGAVTLPSYARSVLVSPNGKNLYAGDVGTSLSQFAVGETGALTALVPPSVSTAVPGIYGLAMTPDGKYLFATSYDLLGKGSAVGGFSTTATGELMTLAPPKVAAGAAPYTASVTADGRFLYVTDDMGSIFGYAVGSLGTLTPLVPGSWRVGASGRPGTPALVTR